MQRILPILLLAVIAASSCDSSPPKQTTTRDASRQAIQQLGIAIELNNQATEFSNQFPSFDIVPTADMAQLKSLWSDALVEARKIDIAALNADEPGLGDMFRDKFIKGLELCTEGDGQLDVVQGQLLLDAFGNEFDNIRAKKRIIAR